MGSVAAAFAASAVALSRRHQQLVGEIVALVGVLLTETPSAHRAGAHIQGHFPMDFWHGRWAPSSPPRSSDRGSSGSRAPRWSQPGSSRLRLRPVGRATCRWSPSCSCGRRRSRRVPLAIGSDSEGPSAGRGRVDRVLAARSECRGGRARHCGNRRLLVVIPLGWWHRAGSAMGRSWQSAGCGILLVTFVPLLSPISMTTDGRLPGARRAGAPARRPFSHRPRFVAHALPGRLRARRRGGDRCMARPAGAPDRRRRAMGRSHDGGLQRAVSCPCRVAHEEGLRTDRVSDLTFVWRSRWCFSWCDGQPDRQHALVGHHARGRKRRVLRDRASLAASPATRRDDVAMGRCIVNPSNAFNSPGVRALVTGSVAYSSSAG